MDIILGSLIGIISSDLIILSYEGDRSKVILTYDSHIDMIRERSKKTELTIMFIANLLTNC